MTLSRYVSIGSALLVAMILTRLLSEDVYGAYRKLWLIYAILGPALISSIANTLYYRGNDADKDSAIFSNLIIGLFYGLGTGALAWFFAGFWAGQLNVSELENGFRLFAPYMALAVFAGIAEPLFVVINRKKWLLGYSFVYNIIESALIIIPFALGFDIETVVLIMCIGPALRSIAVIVVSVTQTQTWPGLKSISTEIPISLKYGFGIILLSFAGIAASEADKWVIGSFFESDALFAIYVIGAKKLPFITALTSAVSAALVTEFATKLRSGDTLSAVKQASSASTRLTLIMLPIITWLFIYAEEVMVLLFGKYEASAPVFRIYMLTVISQLIFPQSITLGSGRSDVNAKFGIAEVVLNISLSILFVIQFGFLGAAFATLISHFFFTGCLLWYCKRAYKINPFDLFPNKKTFLLLLTLPLVIGTGFIFKNLLHLSWSGFLITGLLSAAVILFSLKKAGFKS